MNDNYRYRLCNKAQKYIGEPEKEEYTAGDQIGFFILVPAVALANGIEWLSKKLTVRKRNDESSITALSLYFSFTRLNN